jgi:hypothetical protein
MGYWWSDNSRGKPKYWDKNLSCCYFATHTWIFVADHITVDEKLHDLISASGLTCSGKVREAGHVARTVENENTYKFLVGKPEGNRLLGRPGSK